MTENEIQQNKENNNVKLTRREAILNLIASENIATQNELSRRLEDEGFAVTQATISRDIRELRLVKTAGPGGVYHYQVSKPQEKYHASHKFYSLYRDSVTSVDYAQNLVVIHCYTGMAQAVCATMDGLEWPGVLGTIAGDDTVLAARNIDDKSEWIKNKKIRMHQVFRSMRIFYSIGETRRKSREK